MVKKFLFLALFVVNATWSFADTWGWPEMIITYSQNKEYMLKVYPIKFPDNHLSRQYQRQLKKGIAKDTIVVPCHAVLFLIINSDTIEIWNKPLVNLVSPVEAIVANDGKSVITIDDWHRRGKVHTFVIYGEGGELIKDFELKDISPFPLEQYLNTISSTHWCGNVEYLDNDRVEILFRDEKGKEQKRIFNIKTRAFEVLGIFNRPQESAAGWGDYLLSVAELETRTGINFFHLLPALAQQQIEAIADPGFWR